MQPQTCQQQACLTILLVEYLRFRFLGLIPTRIRPVRVVVPTPEIFTHRSGVRLERTSYLSLWYHGQRPNATHFPGRLIAVNNQVSVDKSRHRRAAVGR